MYKLHAPAGFTLAFIIVLGTLNNTPGLAQHIGFAALAGLLFFGLFLFMGLASAKPAVPRTLVPIVTRSLLFLITYFIGILQTTNSRSLSLFGQIALLISLFIVFSVVLWSNSAINAFAIISGVFILSTLIIWIAKGMPTRFAGYFENKNSFAPILYCQLFFIAITKETSNTTWTKYLRRIAIIAGLTLILAIEARSVWLALISTLITYTFLTRHAITEIRFRSWYYFTIILLMIGTVVYAFIAQYSAAYILNEYTRQYTGGNLLSGRETVWLPLISTILERPLLGFGSGSSIGNVIQTDLSAHNLYIQTAFQVGFVGLLAFFALLAAIWRLLWHGRSSFAVRLSGAFLIGILTHQMFEVSLTQNNLSIGTLQWLVISVGVSKSLDITILRNSTKWRET